MAFQEKNIPCIKRYSHYVKRGCGSPQKLKIKLWYDPTISLLGKYLDKTIIQGCLPLFSEQHHIHNSQNMGQHMSIDRGMMGCGGTYLPLPSRKENEALRSQLHACSWRLSYWVRKAGREWKVPYATDRGILEYVRWTCLWTRNRFAERTDLWLPAVPLFS